jgi:predicted transcriptional regulator
MSKKPTSKLLSLGSKPPLGPLEAQIMEIIWSKGEVTIRDIFDTLRKQRDFAYTTIMTVVHNLYRKGFLNQRKDGNTHFYTASQSRSQFVRSRVAEALDALLEDFTEPALAHLAERLTKKDATQLDELEKMIAERRAQEKKNKNV